MEIGGWGERRRESSAQPIGGDDDGLSEGSTESDSLRGGAWRV